MTSILTYFFLPAKAPSNMLKTIPAAKTTTIIGSHVDANEARDVFVDPNAVVVTVELLKVYG
jgi:hypothetical protein